MSERRLSLSRCEMILLFTICIGFFVFFFLLFFFLLFLFFTFRRISQLFFLPPVLFLSLYHRKISSVYASTLLFASRALSSRRCIGELKPDFEVPGIIRRVQRIADCFTDILCCPSAGLWPENPSISPRGITSAGYLRAATSP